MKFELRLMEMVIVLYINDVITFKERDKFLKYLQNRLDLNMEKEKERVKRNGS